MGETSKGLTLEPSFHEVKDGDFLDLVVRVNLQAPGFASIQTMVQKQQCLTDVKIPTGSQTATLFRVQKTVINGQTWVLTTDQTTVHGHRPFSLDQIASITETCAGLGIVDQGYAECGAKIVAYNDKNIRFCQWLHNSGKNVITGDIQFPSTVQKMAKQHRSCLAAGVSCQPWSKLGDQNGGNDPRAQSLVGTLVASHLLQTPIVLLECTPTAEHAQWFQDVLQAFVNQTGYHLSQKQLHLHTVWPAKRSRWWGVLTHPALGETNIPEFPAIAFAPSLVHVFPKLYQMEKSQEEELALDLYELRQFYNSKEGIQKHRVQFYSPMPTATHSWGSQVKDCKCGCRATGFSSERIEQRGLYAQLVPIPGESDMGGYKVENLRHLHPGEVALANGASPLLVGNTPNAARLELAGVGQCASPIQGLWVYANVLQQIQERFGVEQINPIQTLKQYGNKLFKARDEWLGITEKDKNEYMKRFEIAWNLLGEPNESFQQMVVKKITNQRGSGKDPKSEDGTTKDEQTDVGEEKQEKNCLEDSPKEKEVKHADGQDQESREQGSKLDLLDEAIKSQWIQEPFVKFNNREDFHVGGVPGFETRSSQKRKINQVGDQEAEVAPNNGSGGSSPMATTPPEQQASQESKQTETPVDNSIDNIGVQSIHAGQANPCTVRVHPSKIASFVQAELKITPEVVPVDWLGNKIDGDCREPQRVVKFLSEQEMGDGKIALENCHEFFRGELLWKQKGWVADDEMQYYLTVIEEEFPKQIMKVVDIPNHPGGFCTLGTHLIKMAEQSFIEKKRVGSVILHEHHWTPLIVEINDLVHIQTDENFCPILEVMCQEFWPTDQRTVQGEVIPAVFANDCGFQAIAWLHAKLMGFPAIAPFSSHQAAEWRVVFHQELANRGCQYKRPFGIRFGGASTNDQLKILLVEHGVHEKRVEECATQLRNALGANVVEQILRSPKPWADLKARANLHKPQLQIVLASELQTMIKARAAAGKQFGSKANKSKKNNQPMVQLKSNQLAIPHAVFKQEDGVELSQVQSTQVHGLNQGVILANIEESLPFFAVNSAVSKEGLGMLVIEHNDPRLPKQHSIVRVPLTCKATNEPMLITCALIQLGIKEVSRNVPQQCLAVQEVDNMVIKVLVYKDQYGESWEDFLEKPVKTLLAQSPFDQIDSQHIMDVWDRQYLNNKLSKTAVKDASLFAVSIRANAAVAEHLISCSGTDGKYFEPRNSNGRQPSHLYQVIWLHQKTYGEAVLARQTTAVSTTLVRSGDRYGLRATNQDAEQVHQSHRPDLQFLPGTEIKKYRLAPIPYGSTKQSLAAIFQKWQWPARPLGPQGQTADRSGMVWLVQASEDPSHWIYQLAHGDVLITQEASGNESTTEVKHGVMASQKTLQTLQQKAHPWQIEAQKGAPDPWRHKDPWQSTSSNPKEISVGQIAAIQSNLEAALDKKIQERNDVSMADDVEHRVQELETQVQQMASSMQQFQQQQHQHNQAVYNQIKTVDQKVDQQQGSLQVFLDSKLEEQMQRIEMLFSKRSRHE